MNLNYKFRQTEGDRHLDQSAAIPVPFWTAGRVISARAVIASLPVFFGRRGNLGPEIALLPLRDCNDDGQNDIFFHRGNI